MKFDLLTPCSNCPFRRDSPRCWLGHDRAEGIIEVLNSGGTFQCHKTTRSDPHHCAGALILMKKAWRGFHGRVSLACRLGLLDYNALDLKAPVFNSTDEFIEHHS